VFAKRGAKNPGQTALRRAFRWGAAMATVALLGAGCSGLNPYRIAERSIGDYLKDNLGPAERYRVHVDRDGSRLTGGYLSHLSVSADELQTKGGIRLRRLDADLYGVRFNPKTRALESVERSAFAAAVTEQAANDYLFRHDRGIPDLAVRFEPGSLVVSAAPRLLGVSIPVTLSGRGEAEAGNLIRFRTDAMAVSRLNLPRPAAQWVERRINPVFDLDDLQLPAKLDSVEIERGEMILRGSVRFPL
jgi:hypothetical protein